jgi:hypothetical protein
MSLNGTYNKVRILKIVWDLFPIQNGVKHRGALWPLLISFTLEYVSKKVQK